MVINAENNDAISNLFRDTYAKGWMFILKKRNIVNRKIITNA